MERNSQTKLVKLYSELNTNVRLNVLHNEPDSLCPVTIPRPYLQALIMESGEAQTQCTDVICSDHSLGRTLVGVDQTTPTSQYAVGIDT